MMYLRSAVREYALKNGLTEDQVKEQLRSKSPDATFEGESSFSQPTPIDNTSPTPVPTLTNPTTTEDASFSYDDPYKDDSAGFGEQRAPNLIGVGGRESPGYGQGDNVLDKYATAPIQETLGTATAAVAGAVEGMTPEGSAVGDYAGEIRKSAEEFAKGIKYEKAGADLGPDADNWDKAGAFAQEAIQSGIGSLPYLAVSYALTAPLAIGSVAVGGGAMATRAGALIANSLVRRIGAKYAVNLGRGAITAASSAFTNAILEGGGKFSETLEAGGTREEAEAKGKKVAAYNLATGLSSFEGLIAAKIPGGLKTKALLGGLLEGGEEVYQGVVSDVVVDKNKDLFSMDSFHRAASRTGLMEATVGGIMGSGMSYATGETVKSALPEDEIAGARLQQKIDDKLAPDEDRDLDEAAASQIPADEDRDLDEIGAQEDDAFAAKRAEIRKKMQEVDARDAEVAAKGSETDPETTSGATGEITEAQEVALDTRLEGTYTLPDEERAMFRSQAMNSQDDYNDVMRILAGERRRLQSMEREKRVQARQAKPEMTKEAVEQRNAEGAQRVARREAGKNAATGLAQGQATVKSPKGEVLAAERYDAPEKAPYTFRTTPVESSPMAFLKSVREDVAAAKTEDDLDEIELAMENLAEEKQMKAGDAKFVKKKFEAALKARAEAVKVEQEASTAEDEKAQAELLKPPAEVEQPTAAGPADQTDLFGEVRQEKKQSYQPDSVGSPGAQGYTTDISEEQTPKVRSSAKVAEEHPGAYTDLTLDQLHTAEPTGMAADAYSEDFKRMKDIEGEVADWGSTAGITSESTKDALRLSFKMFGARLRGEAILHPVTQKRVVPSSDDIEPLINTLVNTGNKELADKVREVSEYARDNIEQADVRLKAQNETAKADHQKKVDKYHADRKGAQSLESGPKRRNTTTSPLMTSGVYKVLSDKMGKQAPADQIMGLLRKLPKKEGQQATFTQGVKQEEVADLRLEEWLGKQEGKVRKEDVLAYVDGELKNRLGVEEETYAFDRESGDDAGEGTQEYVWLVYQSSGYDPEVYSTEEEASSALEEVEQREMESYIENSNDYYVDEIPNEDDVPYVQEADDGTWEIVDIDGDVEESDIETEREALEMMDDLINNGAIEPHSVRYGVLSMGGDVIDSFDTQDAAESAMGDYIQANAENYVYHSGDGPYMTESDDPEYTDRADGGELADHYAGATMGGTGYGAEIAEDLKRYFVFKIKAPILRKLEESLGKRGGAVGEVHWEDAHWHARGTKRLTADGRAVYFNEENQGDTAQEGGKTRGKKVKLEATKLISKFGVGYPEGKRDIDAKRVEILKEDDPKIREKLTKELKSLIGANSKESNKSILADIRKHEVEGTVDRDFAYRDNKDIGDKAHIDGGKVKAEFKEDLEGLTDDIRRQQEVIRGEAKVITDHLRGRELLVGASDAHNNLTQRLSNLLNSTSASEVLDVEAESIYEDFHREVERVVEKFIKGQDISDLGVGIGELKREMIASLEMRAEEQYRLNASMDASAELSLSAEAHKAAIVDIPRKRSWLEYSLKRSLDFAIKGDYDFFAFPRTREQVEDIENWSAGDDSKMTMVRRFTEEAPRFFKKYLKRLDPEVKLQEVELENGEAVMGFQITDTLRDKILTEGQPMYQAKKSEYKPSGAINKITGEQRSRLIDIGKAVGLPGEVVNVSGHNMTVRFGGQGGIQTYISKTPSDKRRSDKNAISIIKQALHIKQEKLDNAKAREREYEANQNAVPADEDYFAQSATKLAESYARTIPEGGPDDKAQVYTAFRAAQDSDGFVDWRGRKIENTEQAAAIFQTARDPRYEHLRYTFVDPDADSAVVAVESYTSRSVRRVSGAMNAGGKKGDTAAQRKALHRRNAYKMVDRIGRMKKRTKNGNLEVYILHNHPDGDSTPSPADIASTKDMRAIFAEKGVKLRDHIVINSNEYSVINDNGSTLMDLTSGEALAEMGVDGLRSDDGSDEEIYARRNEHRAYDQNLSKVYGPDGRFVIGRSKDIADLGVSFKTPQNFVSLMGMDAEGRVTGIRHIHKNELGADHFSAMLKNWAGEMGARDVVAYYGGTDEKVLLDTQKLVDRNEINDLVFDESDPISFRAATGQQEGDYGRDLLDEGNEAEFEQAVKNDFLRRSLIAKIILGRMDNYELDPIFKNRTVSTKEFRGDAPNKHRDDIHVRYAEPYRGTIINDPKAVRTVRTPESYKGSLFISSLTDRSYGGGELVDVRGVPLSKSVKMRGGLNYPLYSPGASWANKEGDALKRQRAIKKIVSLRRREFSGDVHIAPVVLNHSSIEFQVEFLQAMMRQMPALAVTTETMDAFDAAIREDFPEFHGIRDIEGSLRQAAGKSAPIRRRILAEIHSRINQGMPFWRDAARAMTDMDLLDAFYGDTGWATPVADPEGEVNESNRYHDTFMGETPGAEAGGLGMGIPAEVFWLKNFQDMEGRLTGIRPIKEGKGPSARTLGFKDMNSLSHYQKVGKIWMGRGNQVADQEWVDTVNMYQELSKMDREDLMIIATAFNNIHNVGEMQQAKKSAYTPGEINRDHYGVHPDEKFDVARTSQNQVPKIYNSPVFDWPRGSRIAELGGGRYDTGVKAVRRAHGAAVIVVDPYARSDAHNKKALDKLDKKRADIGVIANVLNVIQNPDIRQQVLRNLSDLVKPGGDIRIQVYYNRGADPGPTKIDTWQEQRPIATYLPEVQKVFPDAEVKGGYIRATNGGAVGSSVQQANKAKYNADPDFIPIGDPRREDNFRKFFKQSAVVDEDGRPLKLYSGNLSNFSVFDVSRSKRSAYVGSGIYMTDSPRDASENYGNIKGPDQRMKLSDGRDAIHDSDEILEVEEALRNELSRDATNNELNRRVDDMARERLGYGNDGNVMPLYASIQNPLILSYRNGTWLDYSHEVTPERKAEIIADVTEVVKAEKAGEEYDEIDLHAEVLDRADEIAMDEAYQEEPLGSLVAILNSMEQYAESVDPGGHDYSGGISDKIDEMREEGLQSGGMSAHEVLDAANKSGIMLEDYDNTDDRLVGWGEVLRQAAEAQGYDGIIMDVETSHFKDMPNVGEKHYIAFKPEQVKSATGNRGTYDPNEQSVVKQESKSPYNPDFIPIGDPRRDDNFRRFLGNSIKTDRVYHGSPMEFEEFKSGQYSDVGFHVGSQGQASGFAETKVPSNLDGSGGAENNTSRNGMALYMRLENPLKLRDAGRWDAWIIGNQIEEMYPDIKLPSNFKSLKNDKVRDALKNLGFDGFYYLNRFEGMTAKEDISYPNLGFGNSAIELKAGDAINSHNAVMVLDRKHGGRPDNGIWTDEQYKELFNMDTSYAVLDANQLKSATGNQGTYDESGNLVKQESKSKYKPEAGIASGAQSVDELIQRMRATMDPERPKGQKERSAPKSLEKAGHVTGRNLYYTPITNKEDSEKAIQDVVENPDKVWNDLRRGAEGLNSKNAPTHTARGIALISYYEAAAEELEAAGDTEGANTSREQAVDVAGSVSEALTKAGQNVQAAKLVMSISPESVLIKAQRVVAKINESRTAYQKRTGKKEAKISTEEYANLKDLAKDAQAWGDLGADVQKIGVVMRKLLDGKELTATDLKRIKALAGHIGAQMTGSDEIVKTSNTGRKGAFRAAMDMRVNSMEERARAHLADKGVRLGSGIPVDEMASYAALGAAKMYRGSTKFVDWVSEMKSSLPDSEYDNKTWRKIYKASWSTFNKEKKRARKMVAQTKAIRDIVSRIDNDPDMSELPNYEALAQAAKDLKDMAGDAQMEKAQELALAIRSISEPDLAHRLSTLQTMSHLLNPVTINRNILGNELHWRADRLAKYAATPVDWARSKLTGEDRQITFRGSDQGHYWKSFMTGAKVAWQGGNPGGLETRFDLRAPAFRGKFNPATYAEKVLSVSLRGFDYAAYKRAYDVALAELAHLAADKNNVPRGERKAFVLNWMNNADEGMQEIADQYARRITFQDDTWLSKKAVNMKHGMNEAGLIPGLNRQPDPNTGEKPFGFGDLLMKYPKTPSNLFDRAIDYSPLGVFRALYQMVPYWQSDDPDPAKWQMTLARAFVGTGAAAFGSLLYSLGVLSGDDDEDWDAATLLREQTGRSSYQINTSALTRLITEGPSMKALKWRDGDRLDGYNWALPMAIPIAMGADFMQGYNEMAESKRGKASVAVDAALGGLSTALEAFSQMPMLRTMQDVFKGVGYSDGALAQIAKNLGDQYIGLPAQLLTPTLMYQVRKTIDNTRRITDGPSDVLPEWIPTPAHKALNKVIYRMPWASRSLPAAYKTFGVDMPKEIYRNGNNSLFNIFLNPAFSEHYSVDDDVAAILYPFEEVGEKSQFPRTVGRKYQVGGVSFELTADDRSEMQNMLANETTKNFKRLLSRGAMKDVDADDQIKRFVNGWKFGKNDKVGGLNAASEFVRNWFIENRIQEYKRSLGREGQKKINGYLSRRRKRNH